MSADISHTHSTLSKGLGTLHILHGISTMVPPSFPHFFLPLTCVSPLQPQFRHTTRFLLSPPEKLKSSDFVDLSGGHKLQVHFGATDKPLWLSYEFATTAVPFPPNAHGFLYCHAPHCPLHPWPVASTSRSTQTACAGATSSRAVLCGRSGSYSSCGTHTAPAYWRQCSRRRLWRPRPCSSARGCSARRGARCSTSGRCSRSRLMRSSCS
ncbi:hypothetical protein B0H10DRAFT_375807 [Mycena sp. CBHHK59/15]|nr:hypothetical protein B0H10DRAFT_375807 [Mycena sp. CBHHK59/15]